MSLFKFWPWGNKHAGMCLCNECTASIREAAKPMDPWPTPDMGTVTTLTVGGVEYPWGYGWSMINNNIINNNGNFVTTIPKENTMNKDTRDEALAKTMKLVGKLSPEYTVRIEDRAGECFYIHWYIINKFCNDERFPYTPEPPPIKDGVLVVGENGNGDEIIGKFVETKYGERRIDQGCGHQYVDCNPRPVTAEDLERWGADEPDMEMIKMSKHGERYCHDNKCKHEHLGFRENPCSSCTINVPVVQSAPTNYKKGD